MLIDGVVKHYPTAMVDLDTPYFIGKTKVLCMDNPVQHIIIGNIPGASGVQPNLVNTKAPVTPNQVDVTQSLHTGITKANPELSKDVPEPVNNSEICLNTNTSAIDVDTTTDMCAAVQTRSMVAKESKPTKPSKVRVRNQKYYNRRTRDRKLQVGDSVLLLLTTERNKLTLAWRGPEGHTKLFELWETLTTGSRSVQRK